jgi:hypothetical protein
MRVKVVEDRGRIGVSGQQIFRIRSADSGNTYEVPATEVHFRKRPR